MCRICEVEKTDSFDLAEATIIEHVAFDFGALGNAVTTINLRQRDDEEEEYNYELTFETMLNMGDGDFDIDVIKLPINQCPICGRQLDSRDPISNIPEKIGSIFDLGFIGYLDTEMLIVPSCDQGRYELSLYLTLRKNHNIVETSKLYIVTDYSPFISDSVAEEELAQLIDRGRTK